MEPFVYHFQVFLLVWARVGGIVLFTPVLSSGLIPTRIKAILAFMIALVIFPVISKEAYVIPFHLLQYFIIVLRELLIGILIGFLVNMIFAAVQLGAQFFSTQIGVGMNQVFDPLSQIEIPVMGYFFYAFATLVFLAVNGHHMVIIGIFNSYDMMPVINYVKRSETIMEAGVKYFSYMFQIALKLAFPIIATSTIIVLCLALIGKVAPQANVLLLGLPLQFLTGIVFIYFIIRHFIAILGHIFEYAINDVFTLLKGIAG